MKLLKMMPSAFIVYLLFIDGVSAMAQDISQQNKQLLADFANQVFVQKDLTHLQQYLHDDYIQHNPIVPQGLSGFKQFFADWFKAVPDWQYRLEKIVAEGDTVWAYGVYSGTQQGAWLGIPATGKHYSIYAVDIFRIENGKLAEHWDVIDTYGLFKQLGVIE
ncbi:MAG: ester cyclase [Methylophilus sp.]|jgi:steroid delta-isomerase-like uncharacterized protein|nr:MAG: ester cyclase [Methylophilus sp.]